MTQTGAKQPSRILASQFNALNFQLHAVAESMEKEDWLRRAVAGTNLPAFIFWHIPRSLDWTIQRGIRGVPEVLASEPWASKAWARADLGTGYSLEEADAVAADVVPAEILDYADAVRSHVSQWLRGMEDGELDAPNRLTEHAKLAPGYDRPALQEALAPLADQPVWLVLSLDCFAHGWAHVEEIRLLARAGRPRPGLRSTGLRGPQ